MSEKKNSEKKKKANEKPTGEVSQQEVAKDTANAATAEGKDAKETAQGQATYQLTQEQMDEVKSRIDAITAQRDEMKATAQRVQADFDNFRRRTASVRAESIDEGKKDAILAILPAMDSLDRALVAADGDEGALATGVRLVKRQFEDALKKLGIEPIECVGLPFDANLHNAVMTGEEEGAEEGVVLEEFQKGYMIGGRVLRHSMVKVSV